MEVVRLADLEALPALRVEHLLPARVPDHYIIVRDGPPMSYGEVDSSGETAELAVATSG